MAPSCSGPCGHVHTAQLRCGCDCLNNADSYIPPRHHEARINVSQDTNEIVIQLQRLDSSKFSPSSVTISITRQQQSCPAETDPATTVLTAFTVDKDTGLAHFDLKDVEFITDSEKFPRGFYIGKVAVGGCVVDRVGIIKAPSYFVASAAAKNDRCDTETGYVEPNCEMDNPPEPVTDNTTGSSRGADGCLNCIRTVNVAGGITNEKYVPPLNLGE